MSLESELENAEPGDRILVRGRQVGGKVQNIRGRADAWIELVGEDESACVIPEPGYPYAVLRFEDCQYLRVGGFRVEGDGDTERAIQVFRSEHIHIHDLFTAGVTQDHLHLPGCNHVLIQRIYSDGMGGENMGGGKGGHQIYYSKVDGGGDCEDLVAEDCDSVDIAGCAVQANGDGSWLHGVRFTRCRATDYGKLGGSGVNLAQCRSPLVEDLILIAHPLNDNPGVASYDSTSGAELRRYEIDADDLYSGSVDVTPGEPTPPSPPGFVSIPEPPGFPPFEPELGAGMQYCPTCDGSTVQLGPEGEPIPCVTCNGTGQIPLPV